MSFKIHMHTRNHFEEKKALTIYPKNQQTISFFEKSYLELPQVFLRIKIFHYMTNLIEDPPPPFYYNIL